MNRVICSWKAPKWLYPSLIVLVFVFVAAPYTLPALPSDFNCDGIPTARWGTIARTVDFYRCAHGFEVIRESAHPTWTSLALRIGIQAWTITVFKPIGDACQVTRDGEIIAIASGQPVDPCERFIFLPNDLQRLRDHGRQLKHLPKLVPENSKHPRQGGITA